MIFSIHQITFWFKNGAAPRSVNFEPDKINVITGDKSTGKTSILSIIDYCLLSSRSRIVEKRINDSVSWYGLSFTINNKKYLIVRKAPTGAIGSKDVYFSSDNLFPIIPEVNNDVPTVKQILEQEFSIDESIVVPYGGRTIRTGSKVSYRYFLLFNTLSYGIISSETTYFDFDLYERDKYVEALNRIFSMAIGVDDQGSSLAKERLDELQAELDKIQKRKKSVEGEQRLFKEKIIELLIEAQKHDLIEKVLFTADDAYIKLKELVSTHKESNYSNNLHDIDQLTSKKRTLWRKIRNLERFDSQYKEYKENLKADYDSLRPLEYLKQNYEDLIPTLEVKSFVNMLSDSLESIKHELKNKKTIAVNVKDEVRKLRKELEDVEKTLAKMPGQTKGFETSISKYVFIGELKSKLEFFENKWDTLLEEKSEDVLQTEIEDLQSKLKDRATQERILMEFLEISIQKYYDMTKSMGVYEGFKVLFDVAAKVLRIREPDATRPTIPGSQSNFLFLHLALFLGLHEHFILKNPKFVPQFLILDQPSQPYFADFQIDESGRFLNDDSITLGNAFSLLNTFMDEVIKKKKSHFQMIVLEHASKHYWEKQNLEYFHLVEEFRGGNALIPQRAFTSRS